MREFNAELRCMVYPKKDVIDMKDFVKGMEHFNGCPNSTNVNLSVHFTDEEQLLADQIEVEILMNHVDDEEGLKIIFDWNAILEQQKICKIQYLSWLGVTE